MLQTLDKDRAFILHKRKFVYSRRYRKGKKASQPETVAAVNSGVSLLIGEGAVKF
jgi:hypothetical protein